MIINYCEDNEVTNFREIFMGKISKGILYRGSYPVFKMDKKRDNIYDKLVSYAKIGCVLNLADNESGLEKIANLVPWYRKLLKKNNIIGLDIQFEFDFENINEYNILKNKLRKGFKFLIEHNGPYLIHCNAGIDRTGFVAAIIEALLGGGIDEIVYDYLLSYGKKFADENDTEIKINTGKTIVDQLNTIINGKINDKINLQMNVEKYFFNEIGLTVNEIRLLKEKLTKNHK
jgi:hypothetical protein